MTGPWYYYFNPIEKHPNGGTTHLMAIDEYCQRISDGWPLTTLCGAGTSAMEQIDETASGYLTNCKTCRKRAGIDNR